MSMRPATPAPPEPLDLHSLVAGERVRAERWLEVHDPYTGELVGRVAQADAKAREAAAARALAGGVRLSRYERHTILHRVGRLLAERAEAFAQLIRRESGLCIRETRYEVGRAQDVLRLAAAEALRDDGHVFSGDVGPNGKDRKIITVREPLGLVLAITPFNHPLNQVVHKLAPAIVAGTPIILKPSEKTPLTAVRFAELLYEAGLPGPMLSVLLGPIGEVVEPLIVDPRVEAVSFTGSVAIGKRIARTAGYKKLCLELGGNAPLIVMDDADLDLAVHLAAEGCYRNSGQRCTAVKRLLVQEAVVEPFTQRLVEATRAYACGDPAEEATLIGTVIDEPAAAHLEGLVEQAVRDGATLLCGGRRRGAQIEPTVLGGVPRQTAMVVHEAFGPLAPVLTVRDTDDAVALANGTAYGLAAGVVTQNLTTATTIAKRLRTGSVNINEVPGYRIESSPFGGIKESGLGVKEGVIEAARFMTYLKTFSIPW